MFIIELGNTFITPRLMSSLEEFNINKKAELQLKAQTRQKQPDIIEEEYVEGINF
jgi:hypothetical protein